jgi:8-oxo-dGTP pyrophosphatase MutT (NUDIX family)
VTKTFTELWNHVWYQQFVVGRHASEFNYAKNKFTTLQSGLLVNGEFYDLDKIISGTKAMYVDPEWGFPKGRRRIREDDVVCALREFSEETGCNKDDVVLQTHITPHRFDEVFFGTNNVLYKHVYYIAKMTYDGKQSLDINKHDINQVREVRAVEWFSFEEAFKKIRVYNKERKTLFMQVNQIICDHNDKKQN